MTDDELTAQILAARSAKLAAPISLDASDELTQYISVTASGTRYAVSSEITYGITSVRSLARVPGVPADRAGLIAFRGFPLVAVHMAGLLSGSRQDLSERTSALVLGRREPELALLVDAYLGLTAVEISALLPAPEQLDAKSRELISGVGDDGTIVLNSERLFESERLQLSATTRRIQ